MRHSHPNLEPPPLKSERKFFFIIEGKYILYRDLKFGDDPIIGDFRGNIQTQYPKVPQTLTPIFSEMNSMTPRFFFDLLYGPIWRIGLPTLVENDLQDSENPAENSGKKMGSHP